MIVRRDQQDVYESLRRSFSAQSGIVVLLDRRVHDRRLESTGGAEERRRSDRRAATHVDEELSLFGHAVAYQAEQSGRQAEPGDDLRPG
jgi:hypothetical protein